MGRARLLLLGLMTMARMVPERSAAVGLSYRVALVLLCAAYLQGPLTKLVDFNAAQAEMAHFGLSPPALMAMLVIGFELVASAMVIVGIGRRIAALALAAFTLAATFLALRFWEVPPGPARMGATNAFFEHLGLIGGFLIVAMQDKIIGSETPERTPS